MWSKVSSSAPHLLHSGLSDSPIRWRCLKVLCPVRRPETALDCVLLKGRNLALAPRQGPEINSWACLWVLPRPCHHTQCWLTNQHLSQGRLKSNKFRADPSLVNLSAISFPCTPACPAQPHRMLGRHYWRNFLLFHINCFISTVISCGILSPSESQFWLHIIHLQMQVMIPILFVPLTLI